MKKGKLKVLATALVAGAALLFAGCNQQPAETTPPEGPTTVALEGVYDRYTTRPVDPDNVQDAIIVRATVNVGNPVPAKVQFLLDDKVEREVSIGASTASLKPQAGSYTFEWNLNTARLDENYRPVYANGPHSVKVRVVDAEGGTIAESEATALKFNNSDFTLLKLSGNAVNAGGNRYFGGGSVQVEVVPVLYSGKEVQSVTLDVSDLGTDADLTEDATVVSTQTLSEAPYIFTLYYNDNNKGALEGVSSDSVNSFSTTVTFADTTEMLDRIFVVVEGDTVLYDPRGIITNDPMLASLRAIRFDFKAPSGVGAGEVCKSSTAIPAGGFSNSASLYAGVDTYAEAGVGGVKAVLDVKTLTNDAVLSDVELALGAVASPPIDCDAVAKLDGVPEGGFYKVYVKVLKDALGNANEFTTPYESNTFAIDDTAPELALESGKDSRIYFNSTSLDTGVLSGEDLEGNAVGPTLAGYATANDPASGTPPVASGLSSYEWRVNGELVAVTTNEFPGLDDIGSALGYSGDAPQGYYQLTVQAVDDAGNKSEPLELHVLYDNTAPTAIFTAPSTTAFTGGASFTATVHATDNVALKQGKLYWSHDASNIRFEAYSSPVNAFGTEVEEADYSTALTAITPDTGDFALVWRITDQAGKSTDTSSLALTVTSANTDSVGSVSSVTETPDIDATGGPTTLTISHTAGTAAVKAVHVYLWNSNDGTYDYYDYVGDASDIGGGDYAITVVVPDGLATTQFLIVVEYVNGKTIGYTYEYDGNTLTSVF